MGGRVTLALCCHHSSAVSERPRLQIEYFVCFWHRLRASLRALRLRRQIFALNFRSKVTSAALTPESVADTPRQLSKQYWATPKSLLPHVVKSNFQRFLIKTFIFPPKTLFKSYTSREEANKYDLRLIFLLLAPFSPPNENYHKENVSFGETTAARRGKKEEGLRRQRWTHTPPGAENKTKLLGIFVLACRDFSFWLKNKFFAGLPLARVLNICFTYSSSNFPFRREKCFSFI